METEDEKIKRLIKEGLAKSETEDEKIQRLVKEGIAKENNDKRKSESENPLKNKGTMFIIIFGIAALVFGIILWTSTWNNTIPSTRTYETGIYEKASELLQKCNNAIAGNNHVTIKLVCGETFDYFIANRAYLNAHSSTKTWADDTIPNLAKLSTLDETGASTNTGVNTGTSTNDENGWNPCASKTGSALTVCLSNSFDNDKLTKYYMDCVNSASLATNSMTKVKLINARNVCTNSISEFSHGSYRLYGGFDMDALRNAMVDLVSTMDNIIASMP